jgi:hypothetical protein
MDAVLHPPPPPPPSAEHSASQLTAIVQYSLTSSAPVGSSAQAVKAWEEPLQQSLPGERWPRPQPPSQHSTVPGRFGKAAALGAAASPGPGPGGALAHGGASGSGAPSVWRPPPAVAQCEHSARKSGATARACGPPLSLTHTHTLPLPPSLSLSLSLSTRLRVELVQAPHRPADVRLGPDQRPQILGKLRAQVSEQAAGLRQQIPGGP